MPASGRPAAPLPGASPPSPPAGSLRSGAGSRPQPARLGSARLALKARGRRSPGCWKPRRGLFSAAWLRSGEAPRDGENRSARTRCAAGPRGRALLLLVRGRCVPQGGPVEAQSPSERESSSPLIPSHPRVCGTVLPCAAGTAAYLSLPTKHDVYTGCRQGRVMLAFPSSSLLLASLSWNRQALTAWAAPICSSPG